VMALLLGASMATVAQEREEFPLPDGSQLDGYTRTDGTIVLSDEAYCRFLLGSLWGDQKLTFAALIDRSKKQKQALGAAFAPVTDGETLARCVDAVGAWRNEAPTEDSVAAWARRSPVVPESLSGLLPDDFEARPLAQPDEIGPAARTTGFGDTVSAPFEMDARTWLADVDAVACDDWTGTLRDARDPAHAVELRGIREYLYDLVPGTYYWQVDAPACDWSVDLVPIELGPDPNATPLPRVPVPKLHGQDWWSNEDGANPEYLDVAQARQALLDVGLVPGSCTEGPQGLMWGSRVWDQEPEAGTLVEPGSAVDVWAVSDCDVFRGDRVFLD
jgi:hypothetical protein